MAASGGKKTLPMRWPLVAENGPAIVIAPDAVDHQVARRKAFFAEAQPRNQGDRCKVGWLNISFQTMKAELVEGLVQDERQAFGHQPLPLHAGKSIEAEV